MEQAQLFYTRNDVEKAIRKAVAAHPNRRNPRIDGMCVYTGARGSHCIAGEVLWMLGQDVPSVNDEELNEETSYAGLQAIKEYPFDKEAQTLLHEAQRIFDGGSMGGTTPPKWSEALAKMERKQLI